MIVAIILIISAFTLSINQSIQAGKDRKLIKSLPEELRNLWANYIYYASPLPIGSYFGWFRNDRTKSGESVIAEFYPFQFSTWLKKDLKDKNAWCENSYGYQLILLSLHYPSYKLLKKCFRVGCRFTPHEYHEKYKAAKKAKNFNILEDFLTEQLELKTNLNSFLLGVLLNTAETQQPELYEKFNTLSDTKDYGFWAVQIKTFKNIAKSAVQSIGLTSTLSGFEKIADLSGADLKNIASSMQFTAGEVQNMVTAGLIDQEDADEVIKGINELNSNYNMAQKDGTGVTSKLGGSHTLNMKSTVERMTNKSESIKRQFNLSLAFLVGGLSLLGFLVYKYFKK